MGEGRERGKRMRNKGREGGREGGSQQTSVCKIYMTCTLTKFQHYSRECMFLSIYISSAPQSKFASYTYVKIYTSIQITLAIHLAGHHMTVT